MKSIGVRWSVGGVLLLMILVKTVRAQQEPFVQNSPEPHDRNYYLCHADELPTTAPEDMPSNAISNNTFISTILKDSPGIITLWNRFRSPIVAFEVVVDYTDGEGKSLAQATYVGVVPKFKSRFQLLVPPEYVHNMKRTIPVGGSLRVISEGFTVMSRCPTKARVLAARTMFGDGKMQTWTEPDWAIDPILKSFPAELTLSFSDVHAPTSILVRTEITAEGRVASVRATDGNSTVVIDRLKDALSAWVFNPAQKDGQPVSGELSLLIRFNPPGTTAANVYWIEPKELKVPSIVVDLIPSSRASTWSTWYGRRPGGTE